MKRVFLDASCWVAAAGSPSGGSALILKLARAGKLRILATRRVLQEAERNIDLKMGKEALLRYYEALGTTEIELIEAPSEEDEARWRSLLDEKDLHVLAGAYKGAADVLVTLDRRHVLTDKVLAGFPIPVRDTRGFFSDLLQEENSEP